MENKKRKLLIALASILILLGIGSTLAYFTSTDTFENIFNAASCKVTTQEVFSSPTDWKPGDETDKTVTVKSECATCLNARVSYTEKWEDKDGNELPLEKDGKRVAIINLDNTSDWEKKGNYYYYKNDLSNGDTTSSFLKSVTYNSEITPETSCTDTQAGKQCVTSYGDYDGGKYTLTITIETIECNASEDTWGNDLTTTMYTNSSTTYTVGQTLNSLDDFTETREDITSIVYLKHNVLKNKIKSTEICIDTLDSNGEDINFCVGPTIITLLYTTFGGIHESTTGLGCDFSSSADYYKEINTYSCTVFGGSIRDERKYILSTGADIENIITMTDTNNNKTCIFDRITGESHC